MKSQAQGIRYTIIGLIAFIALITGLFVSQYMQKGPKIDPEKFHGTWLMKPRPLHAFKLTGTDTKVFDNESLKGNWTLMFFGFTNCGHVCPTTMAELAKTYRLLAERGVKPLQKVVMVSIDPDRDTLEKMDSYVHAFDKHFYGARGNMDVVKQMTKEMGVVYTRVSAPEEKDAENYDIQHSGAVMVFNPNGELNAFFTTPHKATDLASDYRLMLG